MGNASEIRKKVELSIESEGDRPLAFIWLYYGNDIRSMLWHNQNWGEKDAPYTIESLQNMAVTSARTLGADYSYINKAQLAVAVIERKRMKNQRGELLEENI